MARTMQKLSREQQSKQSDTERLLRDLDERARHLTSGTTTPRTPSSSLAVKTLKSFRSLVRMQEPHKLRSRNGPEHKPVTYGQQLKQLNQEATTTVKPPTFESNPDELFKVYGSKRVPSKHKTNELHSRIVKTYAERLRELRPSQSQARVDVLDSIQRRSQPRGDGKHELTPKVRVREHVKTKSGGFRPYELEETGLDGELDLSSWSLDDKIKNIIYDEDKTKIAMNLKRTNMIRDNRNKKRVTIRDADQDTLADTDGDYMFENLLEDERKNDIMFQSILNDLSSIERREKGKQLNKEELDEADDYVSQVNVDDLKNFSLSGSESALSSFIDWDQIDQLVDTLK